MVDFGDYDCITTTNLKKVELRMKKREIIIGLIMLIHCVVAAQDRQLNVVTFTGSGYELGLQHGKQLKSEIGEIVSKWKSNTTRSFGRDAETVLDEFFAYADFESAIKQWTPDLYDEVRGIAAGSGQELRDIMVLNLLDEFWVYIDNIYNHHCSDVGVPSINGSPSYVAQNMDCLLYTSDAADD